MSTLLTAAALDAPTTTASLANVWDLTQAVSIKLASSRLADSIVVDLCELPVLLAHSSGFAVANVSNAQLTLVRPPGSSVDFTAAIVASGAVLSPKGEEAFIQLTGHTGSRLAVFRSTNTAVDVERLALSVPSGVAQSIIGVYPGLHRPALAIAYDATTIKDMHLRGYFQCTLTCAGQGYRGPGPSTAFSSTITAVTAAAP